MYGYKFYEIGLLRDIPFEGNFDIHNKCMCNTDILIGDYLFKINKKSYNEYRPMYNWISKQRNIYLRNKKLSKI